MRAAKTLVLLALAALVLVLALATAGVDAQPKQPGGGAASKVTRQTLSPKVQARRAAQTPEYKAKIAARTARIKARIAARRAIANGGKGGGKTNGKGGAGGGAGGGGGVAPTAATAPNGEPAAEADVKAFRDALMAFLNKYKGAVEGSAKFSELFPRIEQDRKNTPGYTTCVAFQNQAIGAASAQTKLKLRATPNVNFFDPQLRRKNKIPPNSFMAVPPRGKSAADMANDKTATYVDIGADNSPRPEPGDLFLLAFAKDQSAKLKAGYFSHIGFVTAIKKLGDGKEEWTTVAGGGGSARNKQEAVTEGHMIIDTKTGLTGPVANQPGTERKLQGWVVLKNLITKG